MARRTKARFPQGERLLETDAADGRRAGRVARLSGLPSFLARPGPSVVHRLNPLTKLVLAIASAVAAVVLGGVLGPALIVGFAVLLRPR